MKLCALEPAEAGSGASTPVKGTLVMRVAERVVQAIQKGELSSSDRLPSERELAEQSRVSRNTVTAAYAELEKRGIIRRIHGKGAYLCALPSEQECFSWSGKVSRLANSLEEPVLELLARRPASGVQYPFSAGTPSLEVFPARDYAASVNRVLAESMPAALAIASTEGQSALREALGRWLGLPPSRIMITTGAQEGIDLVARCLIEPGDAVIIDSPSYPGALQSFLSAGARLLPWGTDWSLAQLEKMLLRYRPKLIFTMPTFHNPTGRVMTLKTRLGLLALSSRYKVPVVEDDVYGRTYFADHPMPDSLCRLDRHSQVISLGTASKMLAPGLRIGWLFAPAYIIKQLALIKMRANLFTEGLNQLALADMLTCGHFDEHLVRLRAHHRLLCAAALQALQPSIQKGLLQCRAPAGSLYLWCKLPASIHSEHFAVELESRGVSIAPGSAFEPERKGRYSLYFRLCYTAVPEGQLVEGIRILNEMLEQMREIPSAEPGMPQASPHAISLSVL